LPEAMSGLSDTLKHIAKTRNDLELTKAMNKFRIARAQALSRQDERSDYDQIETDWDGETREAAALAAQGITDGQVREHFQGLAEVDIENDRVRVQDLVFKKRTEAEMGDLLDTEDEYRKLAIHTDAGSMPGLMDEMRGTYTSLANAGFLPADEAERRYIEFRNGVAVERLTAMPAADRMEVFRTQPEWLRNLDQVTYSRLKKEAEAELREDKALATAKNLLAMDDAQAFERLRGITDADEYSATRARYGEMRADDQLLVEEEALRTARKLSGLSSPEAQEALAGIDDHDMYNAVRKHLGAIREDEARALQKRQETLYTSILPMMWRGEIRIEKGVFYDAEGNATQLVKDDLTDAQYANLQREQEDRAKRMAGAFVPTWSDSSTLDQLETLIANDRGGNLAQAMKYFSENSSRLNIADRRYYNQKFEIALAAASGRVNGKEPEFKALETTRQMMDRVLKANDINDVGVQSRMWDALRDWNERYFIKHERTPSDQEIRDRVSLELLEIRRDPDAYYFTDDVYVYEMPEAERARFFDAVELLRAADPNITRAEIIKRYENLLRVERRGR